MAGAVSTAWPDLLALAEDRVVGDGLRPVAQAPDHTSIKPSRSGPVACGVELCTEEVLVVRPVEDPARARSRQRLAHAVDVELEGALVVVLIP